MRTSEEMVSFRLDADLLARIKRYQAMKRASNPGMRVTQSDAIRALLVEALTRHEETPPPTTGAQERAQRRRADKSRRPRPRDSGDK